ncbi:hypothetical protein EC844_101172 [Acinetobacter calcoaceticus]|uniref:Uncharacterized protein n=1 Tax=Acinetobacter calcoaceticus TaxID=471 RepID=A0A4V2R234_ACICA|nr:hypothetical protein EC844_101172 [Acinetobacter calcoaceticus]
MRIGLNIILIIFAALCLFFIVIGVYSLDATLIIIAILFAVAGILFRLEAKHYLPNDH